MQSQYRAMH